MESYSVASRPAAHSYFADTAEEGAEPRPAGLCGMSAIYEQGGFGSPGNVLHCTYHVTY